MPRDRQSTNGTGYQTRRGRKQVFPKTSYWRRQESPALLDQQVAQEPGVKTYPGGRIVGDPADLWLRQHS